MIVLLDLEWAEAGKAELTQLAAMRVSTQWEEQDRFTRLAHPSKEALEWAALPLGGYEKSRFKEAKSEEEVVRDLIEWLQPDDVIWTWAASNAGFLRKLWRRYEKERPCPPLYDMARTIARAFPRADSPNLYAVVTALNIPPLSPMHRSVNSIDMMRQVMDVMQVSPDRRARLPFLMRRDYNRRWIEVMGSAYHYVYLAGSPVFHRSTCTACLNARSVSHIQGSVYYETAAKSRRPCRLCRPDLGERTTKKLSVPQPDAAKQEWPESVEQKANEVKNTKLLTGEYVPLKRKHVVGWCHHYIHRGALTKSLLESHDCLGKACPYFERNDMASYWEALRRKAQEKEALKAKKREEKAKAEAEKDAMQQVVDRWQRMMDELGISIYLVRAAKSDPHSVTVFYVSPNRFADGGDYPNLYSAVKRAFPRCYVKLRHIKDMDGRFLTIEEYLEAVRRRV
ncbi:MAG: hypothetical protein IJU16_03085 [Clostridia bacterium]|nr:hypothetical protein [Clostridia bacterium]